MKRAALTCAAALTLLLAPASLAEADFGLKEVEMSFLQEDDTPVNQAGSHPFVVENTIFFNTEEEPALGFEIPSGSTKDVRVSLPPGFAGNPTATPYCPNTDFLAEDCPVASEIGVADILAGSLEKTHVGVYNLAPHPGVAAKIGFKALGEPVSVQFTLNPDPPHNLIATIENLPEIIPFYGSTLRIWGTPADPAHDSERVDCGDSCSPGLPQKPFIVMPRSCAPTLATLFEIDSWEDPGAWVSEKALSSPLSGCGDLPFAPTISSAPTTGSASSPSGLDFGVKITDEGLQDPDGTASSDIKEAVVTLPEGVSANPALAEGLATCSEAQFGAEGLATPAGAGCPQAAKVGTVEVETPLLEGVLLKGQVYIATPHENPFGTLLALYMTIREPERGIFVGLPGKVEADPLTGQLKTTFGQAPYEVPQFPFSDLRFRFREGARAPLVTPRGCGSYETKAVFTPWADPTSPYTATASFQIGSCPAEGGFDPTYEAGTASSEASSYSPYSLRLTRSDSDPELTRFDTVLPPGVAGRIAGIPNCPDAALAAAEEKSGLQELASPSCPQASRLGRVLVGAGVGPDLTWVEGKIYLAGPFAGHPRSVAVVVPGVAGPFDVGTVVVREALDANPLTSLVEIDGSASEPLPRILKGIPLRVRDVRVFVDRPDFTFNASGCEAERSLASIFASASELFSGAGEVSSSQSSPYQAAGCPGLGFEPQLSLRFKGGMRRNGHPAVKALVSYPYPSGPGHSNLAAVTAKLPKSEFIDQGHINNPCTRVQFNAGACPPGSVLGTAKAWTPILDSPLEGPVYFRSNGGERALPDIVADVRGEGFRVIQVGFVDSVKGRIRTRFLSLPDLPVEKLSLNLFGGKRGLLVNSANLCSKTRRVSLLLSAHNEKSVRWSPAIKTDCQRSNGSAKR